MAWIFFKQDEFACKCECGLKKIDPLFVDKLDFIRSNCGFPLTVNSGCRCEKHNKAEGGKENSAHTEKDYDNNCHAADIKYSNGHEMFMILKFAIKAGIHRIGIARTFIHLDNDKTLPPMVGWLYS